MIARREFIAATLLSGSSLRLPGQVGAGLASTEEFSRLKFVAEVVQARTRALGMGKDVKTSGGKETQSKCVNQQAVKEKFDEVRAAYSGWAEAVAFSIETGDRKSLNSKDYRDLGKKAETELHAFLKAAKAELERCSPREPTRGLPAALAFADLGFKIFDMIQKRIKDGRLEEQKRVAALARQTLAWPTWETI
jgi:hypothetical protein